MCLLREAVADLEIFPVDADGYHNNDTCASSRVSPCCNDCEAVDLSSDSSGSSRCLDERSFRQFKPLLAACQAYAQETGCRFLGTDFRTTEGIALGAWQGQEQTVTVPLGAGAANNIGDVVHNFTERLRAGDPLLLEEINRSFFLVMVESVRNAMIAAFRELEMWPPTAKPDGVDDEDCSYEDVSASLPVIAQRMFNDEIRRKNILIGAGGLPRIRRRAMTASFLIDFAQTAGVAIPDMPETHAMMLQEFCFRVAEWEAGSEAHVPRRTARDAFMSGLGDGIVPDRMRSESDAWWKVYCGPILAASMLSPVVNVAFIMATRSLDHSHHRQRRRRPQSFV